MGIWIDTDLALGAPSGDVDDGYAIAAVLASRTPLLGVSTVFGNTSASIAARCARALLDRHATGLAVPVIEGAARAGMSTAAAQELATLPAGTTLLALGPLTNLAEALQLDPTLATRVTVHLVGGNLTSWGRWPPWWPFEFNLAKDASAARAVFDSAIERVVYPLDECCRLVLGVRGLQRVARASSLGAYLARGSLRWLAFAPLRYRSLRFPLWDLVPALFALGCAGFSVTEKRLRFAGRGRVYEAADATRSSVVGVTDPARALDAFVELISSA